MSVVHVVAPGSIDDPALPSGGNVYDRRLCTELEDLGWSVQVHAVAGSWPHPTGAEVTRLGGLLESLGEAVVLVDGLVASAAPTVVSGIADRCRLVVLVHLPLGVATPEMRADEGALLRSAAGVVVTSDWTRTWLAEHESVPARSIRVALPGSGPADPVAGSAPGNALLCVGAVGPGKGQDVLLDALATLDDLSWTCTVVGSLEVDRAFAREVATRAADLQGRVVLTGPLDRDAVDTAYRSADLVVLPSRVETYGMVVTEALARGLPVVASHVGGVPEALGTGPGGVVPGALVAPGDPRALAAALRAWLTDPSLRERTRAAAHQRRRALPSWRETAVQVAAVLTPP